MSSGREIILRRIREALKVPAPFPGTHGDDGHPRESHGTPSDWLPPVGDSPEERLELFRANLEALRARLETPPSASAAAGVLVQTALAEAWKRCAYHPGPLTSPLAAALGAAGVDCLDVSGGYDIAALESCDAGLTACDALVAQTGSILVSSRTCGGRALSVLPPHHLVAARGEQLLPDLTAAFEHARRAFGPDYPSMLSLITGPSRTGDIERILVLGAHGPKKLTVLLLP